MTKVSQWQENGGDWWRDTEFMCPATLRAVCNLQTMVINCMLELHDSLNLHAILYTTLQNIMWNVNSMPKYFSPFAILLHKFEISYFED